MARLDEGEQVQQAEACLQVMEQNKERSFCQHKAPLLEKEIEQTKETRKKVAKTETTFLKERKEAQEALGELVKKTREYAEMTKIELPHVEDVRGLGSPENLAEKEEYVMVVQEVIDTHAADLYFSAEALDLLGALEQKYAEEAEEATEAKEKYHQAVAEKDGALSKMSLRVRQVKRFVRTSFGVRSRQYQSLKDSAFHQAPRPSTPQQPPTPPT